MKKLLLIMCVSVCAVLLSNCGSPFEKERDIINEQIKIKNYATVLENADIIRNAKDKASALDLVTAGFGYFNVVSLKVRDGYKDYDEVEDLYIKSKECLQAAKTKDDYAYVVDFLSEYEEGDGIHYNPAYAEQQVVLLLDDLEATRGSIYRDQIFAITEATKNNDQETILANANIILEGADKANAYDLVFIGVQYGGIGTTLFQNEQYEDALAFLDLGRQCMEAAQQLEGYDRVAERFKQIDLNKLVHSYNIIIEDIQRKMSAK